MKSIRVVRSVVEGDWVATHFEEELEDETLPVVGMFELAARGGATADHFAGALAMTVREAHERSAVETLRDVCPDLYTSRFPCGAPEFYFS